MESIKFTLDKEQEITKAQIKEIQKYLNSMPVKDILAGLKFAKNRWDAKDAGVLNMGRKSIVQKEIEGITSEQAVWRLNNWKIMIVNYREKGYSYPTISRIKKILITKRG
ncbi:MAG: hypothetical protein R1F52_00735 [Candidatus Nitrosoabyssus spongiisocia]|nr:MAG: hypothetical protein R1F52_00735 [Nitrosopumilaceae archaeon AB1(1)]